MVSGFLVCYLFTVVVFRPQDKSSGISSRRHYHATCDHRHKKGGPKGGMIFHHHQLEKIQKHQRAHIRTLHKKTPGMCMFLRLLCLSSHDVVCLRYFIYELE